MNITQAAHPIRMVLKGSLNMHGAFASAGTEVRSGDDATLLRDGGGKVLLSGTGLKGALRSLMERILDAASVESLFGKQDNASRIVIEDAALKAEGQKRHRVAINRKRGVAANGLLFDQEMTGPDTAFPARITVKSSPETLEADRKALAWIKALLEEGAVTPGGDSRRGAGHCRLGEAKFAEYNKCEEDGLAEWLAKRPPTKEEKLPDLELTGGSMRFLAVDLSLAFKDGVLVGGGDKKEESSDLVAYAMTDAKGNERLVLPGGGIRGILRQEVERLWRLRGAGNVCDPTEAGGWCSAARKRTGGRDDGADLCPVCALFGAVNWRAPLAISDFVQHKDGNRNDQLVDHVAINRFHGGAEESKKFDETPVFADGFEGRVVLENPTLKQLAVLAHLGLMAHDGELWFGHSTHRGIGRLTGVTVKRLGLLQAAPWTAGLPAPFDGNAALITRLGGEMDWKAWLAALEPAMQQLEEV